MLLSGLIVELNKANDLLNDILTRIQLRVLFGLRLKLPPVTTSLSTLKVEAIPLSA